MRNKLLPRTLFVFFCLSSQVGAQTLIPQPHPGPHYVVLDTRKISTMKEELTLTAMQGYRVVAVAPRPGGGLVPAGLTVIMERVAEGVAPPEYWIADAENGIPLDQLNLGTRTGYRYVKGSAFLHMGHDFWGDLFSTMIWGEKRVNHRKYDKIIGYALMERTQEGAISCRYQLPMTNPRHGDGAVKRELGEGFRVVGALGDHLILESCAEGSHLTEDPAPERAILDPAERFRLLSGDKRERKQQELDQAVAQGYRIAQASGKWLSLVRDGSPAGTQEYRLLAAKVGSALEQKLNSARGFRMVSDTMALKPGFWSGMEYQVVVEKTADDAAGYQYLVRRESKDVNLQEMINDAAKEGYQVKALARDAFRMTVILERPAATGAERKPQCIE